MLKVYVDCAVDLNDVESVTRNEGKSGVLMKSGTFIDITEEAATALLKAIEDMGK